MILTASRAPAAGLGAAAPVAQVIIDRNADQPVPGAKRVCRQAVKVIRCG